MPIFQEIFDKIDFWIRETQLDEVVSCCACMEDGYNLDEGVGLLEGRRRGRFADVSLNA